MRVHFWGVRGSLPTPLSPMQIKSKITAIVQRITQEDLASEDAREHFIENLPTWLNSTVGGNTACIEINADNNIFILDAGSGLREMGSRHFEKHENVFHLFFSHFHWDHIQGIPFFSPLYNPNCKIHLYSPWPAMKEILTKQMSFPYFPVKFESVLQHLHFHVIKPESTFNIGNVEISCHKMYHPGSSYSYSFSHNGKKMVYATDVELSASDWKEEKTNAVFFKNADMLVFDAQYTIEELHAKQNWGHSSCCSCVDAAINWGVKRLYLFHHEPGYDDKKVYNILNTARWYADSLSSNLCVELATESTDVLL